LNESSLISVVLNCDGGDADECIRRILAQTHRELELILACADGQNYPIDDPRVRVFRPVGTEGAVSGAIADARGAYIAFATPDKWWPINRLERQYQYLSTEPDAELCFIGSATAILTGNDVRTMPLELPGLLRLVLEGSGCLCRTEAVFREFGRLGHIQDLEEQLEQAEQDIADGKNEIAQKEQEITTWQLESERLTAELMQRDAAIVAIRSSISWRLTKPMRAITTALRSFVSKHPKLRSLARSGRDILHRGPKVVWQERQERRELENWLNQWKKDGWLIAPASFGLNKEHYDAEQSYTFSKSIKFSILVPLYNTPERFLREMIQSVQLQTYSNWELCLADGSDGEHPEVERICKEYANKDKRICYQKLEENLGISGNTNACLAMATGDYIGLFDHDDLLHPSALYEDMKAICEQDADFLYTDENTFHDVPSDAYCPNYKPDFAPDTLRSYNYICHFTVFARSLLEQVGQFRPECDGSQDYDLILRLTEQAQHIVHIPNVLYFWRASAASTASDIGAKPYIMDSAQKALTDHLERTGLKGRVENARIPSTYRIRYEITGKPMVSILIPSCDHTDVLKRCVDSIIKRSTWKNYEIVIVENNSKLPATFEYYRSLEQYDNVQVVTVTPPNGEFNYSFINNEGAKAIHGDYLLLLNNDIEVISPGWIEEMLMFAQRPDVGAVGAMLYYPSNKVQHGGVVLGIGGVAGHAHKYFPRGDYGYMSRLCIAQNYSACTAACLMVRRNVWDEVKGLDETFKVAFNDVDFCLRIRKAGYLIVWTPYAELYHYESESRGTEDTPEKVKRFNGEMMRFQARWGDVLKKGDPYYNPNLSLTREDFSLRKDDKN
jgi:O-antigen biosynthesis protein